MAIMSGDLETTPERDQSRYSSRTVMWLLGSMVLIPVKAFVYGMEIFVRTLHGMQYATDRGLGVIAGDGPVDSGAGETTETAYPASAGQSAHAGGAATGTDPANIFNAQETIGKETVKMTDTNLNDDMLKLVRYKILFIKRDFEHAFDENEELVYDNMTDSAFTAWKIAEFVQSLEKIEIPEKWQKQNYPRAAKSGEKIHSLDESDKKYLRVYFEVLQRYAREKLKYEEDQLTALRGIKAAIEKHGVPGGPAGEGSDRKKAGPS
jgi:hypothetical protein